MSEILSYRPTQENISNKDILLSNIEASPAILQYAIASKAIELMSRPTKHSRRTNINY
jgi:hypothetical protein